MVQEVNEIAMGAEVDGRGQKGSESPVIKYFNLSLRRGFLIVSCLVNTRRSLEILSTIRDFLGLVIIHEVSCA